MILAFAVSDQADNPMLDERFGRCSSFCVLDSETESKEVFENPMKNENSSAGIGAVQLLAEKGVEGLIAPHLGPKADDARTRLHMRLWHQGSSTTVAEALGAWRDGSLEEPGAYTKPIGLYRA